MLPSRGNSSGPASSSGRKTSARRSSTVNTPCSGDGSGFVVSVMGDSVGFDAVRVLVCMSSSRQLQPDPFHGARVLFRPHRDHRAQQRTLSCKHSKTEGNWGEKTGDHPGLQGATVGRVSVAGWC